MVIIRNGGITLEVNESDLQTYLSAGYEVVKNVQPKKAEKEIEPPAQKEAVTKAPKGGKK